MTGFSSAAANPSETLTITYSGKTTTYTVVINTAPVTLTVITSAGVTGSVAPATGGTPITASSLTPGSATIYRYKPDLVANQ